MKKLSILIVAIAAALLFSPFVSRDVGKLVPVQTLCMKLDGGLCRVETDGGLYGLGTDPARAIADLERTAPGLVTLSTARQLVVEDEVLDRLRSLAFLEALHPGTEVYRSPDSIDSADVTPFLNRHASGVSVGHIQSVFLTGGEPVLPCLVGGEGRYQILDKS